MPDGSPNRGIKDEEIQWHARHGIVLMVAELVLLAAYIVMTSLVSLAACKRRFAVFPEQRPIG